MIDKIDSFTSDEGFPQVEIFPIGEVLADTLYRLYDDKGLHAVVRTRKLHKGTILYVSIINWMKIGEVKEDLYKIYSSLEGKVFAGGIHPRAQKATQTMLASLQYKTELLQGAN